MRAAMAVPALPAGTCRAEGTCPADCSVVLVQPALPPTAQANGTQGSTGAAGMSSGQLLLISCGQGDLSLCSTRASSGGHAAVSPAVFPLREQAPLVGVRPFKLEAAYMLKPGAKGPHLALHAVTHVCALLGFVNEYKVHLGHVCRAFPRRRDYPLRSVVHPVQDRAASSGLRDLPRDFGNIRQHSRAHHSPTDHGRPTDVHHQPPPSLRDL